MLQPLLIKRYHRQRNPGFIRFELLSEFQAEFVLSAQQFPKIEQVHLSNNDIEPEILLLEAVHAI